MQLMQVRANRALHWPEDMCGSHDRVRGLDGYVVDLDAPMEKRWCDGQLHKLEPAPEGATAAPITFTVAVRALKEAAATPSKGAASDPSLPAVDIPKKRAAAKVA